MNSPSVSKDIDNLQKTAHSLSSQLSTLTERVDGLSSNIADIGQTLANVTTVKFRMS